MHNCRLIILLFCALGFGCRSASAPSAANALQIKEPAKIAETEMDVRKDILKTLKTSDEKIIYALEISYIRKSLRFWTSTMTHNFDSRATQRILIIDILPPSFQASMTRLINSLTPGLRGEEEEPRYSIRALDKNKKTLWLVYVGGRFTRVIINEQNYIAGKNEASELISSTIMPFLLN